MGVALARTLMAKGSRVTVFNRTIEKAKAVEKDGAVVGASAAAAIASSSIVVVCLADYAAARRLLEAGAADGSFEGRTIVHLSTGTPKEAREMNARVESLSGRYLDGAILVTPSQIGTEEASILVGGKSDVFREAEPVLRSLAPLVEHVGEDVGAAAALDLAFLSYFFGGLLGFYHGVRIMETENLPVTVLGNMVGAVAGPLGKIVQQDGERIARNDLETPESSLQNSATVVELILKHAEEKRLDKRFPHFAAKWFKEGVDAGFGKRDTAALVELLRRP
jgi:3-hydroxyisobutyrate dehydrogenase-like beta-hydroxyacid dehydrogenase